MSQAAVLRTPTRKVEDEYESHCPGVGEVIFYLSDGMEGSENQPVD